ncbi:hypothetical protein [Candidatus Accumulibacter sp. ACC003]|uniref:hypothetical protein n=1 Tax=Candidatus Accumulibacter sp. ACC003 TaxID=2823334 RepID=UPI0025C4FD22|nr:hypothetical protein [Candidatus Accumulibacter sp. ACC003]
MLLAVRTPEFYSFIRHVLAVAIIGGSLVATASEAAEVPGPVVGAWGGDRLNLILDVQGGKLDYDCGSGSINEPLRIDSQGQFTARGAHTAHHAGPEMAAGTATTRAATYDGRVFGTVLELRVRIDDEAIVRSYRLEKNQKVKLIRCR